jgi:hypothetical protein
VNRLLFILVGGIAIGVAAFDKNRPFTAKFEKKTRVQWDEYELPYLHVALGVKFPLSSGVMTTCLKSYLQKAKVNVHAHLSASSSAVPADMTSLPFPKAVISEDQLKGIQQCEVEECRMKLSNTQEKFKMKIAEDKVKAYHAIVADRVNRFVKKHELVGYEDRAGNETSIVTMLKATKFFPLRFPKQMAFFEKDLWKGNLSASPFQESFLRSELVAMAPDRMQPIWRISEVFESATQYGSLFVEVHIYTNHYFDASLRVYEIQRISPTESVLLITDVMEIDELKKSAFIRALYTGKMVEAVVQHQENEIDAMKAMN